MYLLVTFYSKLLPFSFEWMKILKSWYNHVISLDSDSDTKKKSFLVKVSALHIRSNTKAVVIIVFLTITTNLYRLIVPMQILLCCRYTMNTIKMGLCGRTWTEQQWWIINTIHRKILLSDSRIQTGMFLFVCLSFSCVKLVYFETSISSNS